jgi:hypothetical protein
MKFNGLLVFLQELTTFPMLSQMNPVHEAPEPNSTCVRATLILSSPPHAEVLFPLGFCTKTLCSFIFYPINLTCPTCLVLIILAWITNQQRTSLHNFLQLSLISALLGLNILMTQSFNYVSLCCALNMTDQVSQP